MKTIFNLILVLGLAVCVARAQDDAAPPMPAQTFSDAQLDQLLGPIALYPDPLIAIILPAATLPSQIVVADRYVQNGGDPNAIDQQGWDPNIQALAHYPDVLKWMDDNLTWTTQLGEAFQNQQQSVMDSVQRLRTDAYNLGNLQSTPQQQVVDDSGYIEIVPVSPDNLYVPDYQPQQVYYDPPSGPPYITFSVGFVIGPWLCGDFDWAHHNVIFWDRDHPRPANWWSYRPQERAVYFDKHTVANVWHPENRPAFSGDRGYEPNSTVNVNVNVQNNHIGNTQPPRGNIGQPPHDNNSSQRTVSAPIVNRPSAAPAPPQHFDDRGNDAYIGIQNAHDTRSFSDRGQQSEQTMPHYSAPSGGGYHSSGGTPPQSGGGGGGRH